ncbi:cytochrome b/b6 domain-containing protein [Microbacterium sp.]|uniref:cytochrome b/b6 domain-containing protein n=1 Tax=Microbacterium sp. TaxID=51671 RepID=UPI0039E69909
MRSAPAADAGGESQESPVAATTEDGSPLRRGLPRTADGDPWPPAGMTVRPSATSDAPAAGVSLPVEEPETTRTPSGRAPSGGADSTRDEPEAAAPTSAAAARPVPAVVATDRAPLTVPRTVWPGRAAYHRPPARPAPTRFGPFTRMQWVGAVLVGGMALLYAAALAVTFVRALLSLPALQEFLVAFPGEYHLPESAPVGIPAWLGWQHFFNVFLMVLIIRSGLQVRTEKRPSVFWTPRRNRKGKISLALWFHQALDILWLVNGAVFIVLLFVTGHWMRIVPTSWEVFPNALSAALQYVSLDWPTENGWVNYNALQQLAYFSTVFLAAPLAALTGYRMSGMWPKKAARLNAAFPVEWARRLHFPVMLYFVVFIFIHVALVLATGALRNLNHMYAAQGSVDGVAYADNWTGFWMFFASLVVIAGAWIAARPLVLAPIAKLFGTVTAR